MNEKYQIIFLKSAQKEIRNLPIASASKIIASIKELSVDPRPSGCKKLVGFKNYYRIREGNYRILYTIEDRVKIVEVSAVKHRSEAYE